MVKASVMLLVLLLVAISAAIPRRKHSNTLLEIAKMIELDTSFIKLINEDIASGGTDFRKYQVIANNQYLYVQDVVYFLFKAAENAKDSILLKKIDDYAKGIHGFSYEIGKRKKTDAAQTRNVTKVAFEGFLAISQLSKPLDDALIRGHELPVVQNYVKKCYDAAFFNFNFAYLQLKYYDLTQKELESLVEVAFSKVITKLEKPVPEDQIDFVELKVYAQDLCFFVKRLLLKIERLTYINEKGTSKDNAVTKIFRKLEETVATLQTQTGTNQKVAQLKESLKAFFRNSSVEFSKLSEICDEKVKYEKDTCKDILTESITIPTTFNDRLDILFHTK